LHTLVKIRSLFNFHILMGILMYIQESRVSKLKIEHLSKCGAGDARIDNSVTTLILFEMCMVKLVIT
jgi:hypothetical protein